MMNLLKVLSDRIVSMSQLTQNLALGNLHDKILHTLMKLSERFGLTSDDEYYKIDFPLSHQEIANLVGATREAVTVALQELVKEEIIKTGYKTIFINREKLLARHITSPESE
ncbi:Global nitrogen regulator [compost metagenome]